VRPESFELILPNQLFLVGGRRVSPAAHPPKTLFRHGARTSEPREGPDPSAAEVRLNLDTGQSRLSNILNPIQKEVSVHASIGSRWCWSGR